MRVLFRWVGSCAALLALGCSGTDSGGTGGSSGIEGDATFSALYDDYFSPTGAASCGGDWSNCHASADATGAVVSNLVGTDKATFYATLTGDSKLVRAEDTTSPADAPLLRYLRQPTGAGKMPKDSTFVFHEVDIQRIEDWIGNGAKDD